MLDNPSASDEPSQSDETAVAETGPEQPIKLPLFGVRKRARELAEALAALQRRTEELGLLSAVELQARRDALAAEIATQERQLRTDREKAEAEMTRERDHHRASLEKQTVDAARRKQELEGQLVELEARITVTEETALLQEVGIFDYRHPLSDSIAYQSELQGLKDQVKVMTRRDGGAIFAATDWTVNGSKVEGRRMVRETSKLMLRLTG